MKAGSPYILSFMRVITLDFLSEFPLLLCWFDVELFLLITKQFNQWEENPPQKKSR
jgi:hypothetical protein